MAGSKLYMRDTTAITHPASIDSGTKSLVLPSGTDRSPAAQTARDLSASKGTTQTSRAFSNTSPSLISGRWNSWVSAVLGAGGISAQNWTFALAHMTTSNAALPLQYAISLYVLKSDGTVRGYIIDSATARGSTNAGGAEKGHVDVLAGAAVAGVVSTDQLVLEVWGVATQSGSTSRTATMYFDGTVDPTELTTMASAASYIEAATQDIFASSGHVVVLIQPSETDTANAFTHPKTLHLTQPAEADTATVFKHPKTLRQAQPSEADSATAFTHYKTVRASQPSETDSANAFAHPKTLHLSQASEVDSANTLTPARKYTLTQPSEADSALAFSHFKALHLTQPSEADSASAFTKIRREAFGQPSEADSANVFSWSKRVGSTQALEADSGSAFAKRKNRAILEPSEADSAYPFSSRRAELLGRSNELDEGRTVSLKGVNLANRASEADSAQIFVGNRTHTFGQSTEADSGSQMLAKKLSALGRSLESDSAQVFVHNKNRSLALPLESDIGLRVFVQRTLHQSLEVDTARSPGHPLHMLTLQAFESDLAIPLNVPQKSRKPKSTLLEVGDDAPAMLSVGSSVFWRGVPA